MERWEKIAWLKGYSEVEQDIDRLSEDIRRWAARAELVCTAPRSTPAAPGQHASPQERCVEKIAALQQEILGKIDGLERLRAEREAAIAKLPQPAQRQVLRLRYLRGMPLEEAAAVMSYSSRQISRLHNAALAGLSIPDGKRPR